MTRLFLSVLICATFSQAQIRSGLVGGLGGRVSRTAVAGEVAAERGALGASIGRGIVSREAAAVEGRAFSSAARRTAIAGEAAETRILSGATRGAGIRSGTSMFGTGAARVSTNFLERSGARVSGTTPRSFSVLSKPWARVEGKPIRLTLNQTPNAGGAIRSFVTTEERVFYRVFSERPVGRFLTPTRPSSRAFAQEGLALPPQNQALFYQEVRVPAGVRLQRSRAMPAFGRRGGLEQFELLERVPESAFGRAIPLK